MTHRLTAKDTTCRTAVCSVCGPVRILRAGNGWVCATKHREHQRAHRRRNPGRPRSQSTNPHRLEAIDHQTRRSSCSVCGPVRVVPWARGWICPTRAAELGRVVEQAEPQPYCRDCAAADGVRVWLDADGTCPRCAETDLSIELAKLAAHQRSVPEDATQAGLHIIGMGDPYEMLDYESAVPGWRTIA